MERIAFRIDTRDNVATALTELAPGPVQLAGDGESAQVEATEPIPRGHKLAVKFIAKGADVVKYGVPIGIATADIAPGSWVHLHVMRSAYDERSAHLNLRTGAPEDTRYE